MRAKRSNNSIMVTVMDDIYTLTPSNDTFQIADGTMSWSFSTEPEHRVGYLVPLDGVSLADGPEGESTSWLHAMPVGEYKHPLYGDIKFTSDRIQRFAQNIMRNVRGIDIAIDYGHRNGEEAAGWVKAADARPSGLWLLVQWTKDAASKIRNREFRYFSPEFVDKWTDAKGTKHKDVLLGGGLTNRPFLKDLLPVNLSEVLESKQEKEEQSMSDKLLLGIREALGLDEGDDIVAAIKELKTPPAPKEEPAPAVMSEDMKALEAENQKLTERLEALEVASQLSEVSMRLNEWHRGGEAGKHGLPPALDETVKGVLLSLPSKLVPKVTEMISEIVENGLVPLQETPTGPRPKAPSGGGDETATEQFLTKVQELKEGGMDDVEAYAEASRDTELFEAYREEQHLLAEEEEVA